VRNGRLKSQQLAQARRGSGGVRADLEGRPVLERCAVSRVEGARGLAGLLAVAADVPAAHRVPAAHLALAQLGSVPSADLGARGARPPLSVARRAGRSAKKRHRRSPREPRPALSTDRATDNPPRQRPDTSERVSALAAPGRGRCSCRACFRAEQKPSLGLVVGTALADSALRGLDSGRATAGVADDGQPPAAMLS
jgi:hypothetical protein